MTTAKDFCRAVRAAEATRAGTVNGATAPRSLHLIAHEIQRDWSQAKHRIYFGAVPYIRAMMELDKITDKYGEDSAKSIVLYFLSNAQTWRGPVARHIKAELKAMAGVK